jgi:hypothetical protein
MDSTYLVGFLRFCGKACKSNELSLDLVKFARLS